MFTSVLVANRGEIAVRIIRTLRKLGIRSVVVASIPDRASVAARSADAVVLLEGYSAAETYLDARAVIAAAKAQGCEAIHPGYGFLSERADFAELCAAEGLVFIGPPPEVLRALGDKSAARRLAVANGVPVVPGYDGPDDDASLVRAAASLGLPLLVKARGGGGGRGMREVHDLADLPEALASARREAQAAFGDPGLLLETLVAPAHHVEVQIVGDAHGHLIHLGERDCSVQRRRQKLIEETPSPVVDDALRAELTRAALRLARAVGYVNAGTFEFLVGDPPSHGAARPFYFLEVNPRLQVEHPVTEMVTGLDLVELQLCVAAGEPLPLAQEDVRFDGHAIEFRLNAEDPWNDFRPGAGRLTAFSLGDGRLDAGFGPGSMVPSQYDSLLAKLIVHSEDRAGCLATARRALAGAEVRGVPTNLPLHRAVASDPEFVAGGVSVSWLERSLAVIMASQRPDPEAWARAAAALTAASALAGPFSGARWLGAGSATTWLGSEGLTQEVSLPAHHAGAGTAIPGIDQLHAFRLVPPPALPRRAQAAAAGASAVTAPLSGTVAAVRVAEGDAVEVGQLLALLEAMKMEHRITATAAGTVARVAVRVGDVVREGDTLVELA
jgi:acetyl/propionyl-CoA carboxylase alpha subunit